MFKAKKVPLTGKGKVFLFFSFFLSVLILLAGIFAYLTFPEKVAVHFNIEGAPDRFGGKVEVLINSLLFFLVSLILPFVIKLRYYFLENLPYLLNLPAFLFYAESLGEERQSFWLNIYFEFLCIVAFLTSAMLFVLEIYILFGSKNAELSSSFYIVLPAVVGFYLAFVFVYLRNLNKKLKAELREHSQT